MKLKLIWVTKILDKILNLSIAPPWYTKSYKNINETRWEICRNTWRNESSQYTRCANIVYAPIFFLAVVAREAPFIRKKKLFLHSSPPFTRSSNDIYLLNCEQWGLSNAATYHQWKNEEKMWWVSFFHQIDSTMMM